MTNSPIPRMGPSPEWDALPIAVYGCDAEGNLRFYNPKAAELWGYAPDLKAQRYCPAHRRFRLDGSELDASESPMADALAAGERISRSEGIVARPDGTRVIYRASVELLKGGDGKLAGAICTLVDVSDLMDGLRMRDEFLSMASHELRTPLTALRLQVDMRSRLLAKGDTAALDPEVYKRTLGSDKRQIERLAKLVDDMLDISRINVGKLPIVKGWFNLTELVADVVQALMGQAAASGCEIHLEAHDEVHGSWDFLRLEQVIFNLLSNAIKFGAGHPIHVVLRASAGMAELVVTDGGPGIAPGDHERIFERYERIARKGGDDPPGLGLGLYIARWIVGLHDGQIRVDSDEGKGASFIVRLPITSH